MDYHRQLDVLLLSFTTYGADCETTSTSRSDRCRCAVRRHDDQTMAHALRQWPAAYILPERYHVFVGVSVDMYSLETCGMYHVDVRLLLLTLMVYRKCLDLYVCLRHNCLFHVLPGISWLYDLF